MRVGLKSAVDRFGQSARLMDSVDTAHPREAKPREPALEALRGIASLQVLFLHVFSAFWPALAFGSALPSLAREVHASPVFLVYDGNAAPYLFFVLSGYVLTPAFAAQIAAPGAAIISRWVRLAAPAIAACAVSALAHALFQPDRAWAAAELGGTWLAGGWDPPGGIANFFIDAVWRGTLVGYTSAATFASSYVAPLWTLSLEFKASILTLGLVWVSARRPTQWRVAVGALAAVCIGQAYLCFIVGHWLAKSDARVRLRRWPWPAKLAMALAGAALMLADESRVLSGLTDRLPGFFDGHISTLYGALAVFVAFLSSASAERWLSVRPLVALGRLSFPLYLIHWPIVFGLGSWAFFFARTNLAVGNSTAAAVAIVASCALSLAGAHLFAHVDLWAVDVSRRLRRRLSAPPPSKSFAPVEAAS